MKEDELIVQDILTLIGRKTKDLKYNYRQEKAKTIQIIIEFKELIFSPNEELLIEALRSLSRIESKWIPFRTENEEGQILFNVIDKMVFSEEKMRFEISYFYLSKMKKANFILEKFISLTYR